MSLFGYPRGLRHLDAEGNPQFLTVSTRPDVAAEPQHLDAVLRIPTGNTVRTYDVIGSQTDLKVSQWLARMANSEAYFGYWAKQGFTPAQLVRHKAAITDAARLHINVLENELSIRRSSATRVDEHQPTMFTSDGGAVANGALRLFDAIVDEVEQVYDRWGVTGAVNNVEYRAGVSVNIWFPPAGALDAKWSVLFTEAEALQFRKDLDSAVVKVLSKSGKYPVRVMRPNEYIKVGAGVCVYDGFEADYAIATTDPFLANVNFHRNGITDVGVSAAIERRDDSVSVGVKRRSVWTNATYASWARFGIKYLWDDRAGYTTAAAAALGLASTTGLTRQIGSIPENGCLIGPATISVTPKGRSWAFAYSYFGAVNGVQEAQSAAFQSQTRTTKVDPSELFPMLTMMEALKTVTHPGEYGNFINVSSVVIPGLPGGNASCWFQFSEWSYRVILPYYMNELMVKQPTVAISSDAVDTRHKAIAMARTDIHVEILGTSVRAYMTEMKTAIPSKAAEIDVALKKGEAFGDAVFRATILDVPLTRVNEAVKATELWRKVDKADEDLYAQKLCSDPLVTFKQAQNRINGLVPQDVWLAVIDDVINPINELPADLLVYASEPHDYRLTKLVTGVYAVCTPTGQSIVEVPTEDAAVLRMAGLSYMATAAIDNTAALVELDTIVGTDRTFEQVGFQSDTHGGTWQDLQPAKFMAAGYPDPKGLASPDAIARCWIAFKGIDCSSSEVMIKAMLDVTPLNAGLA